MHLLAKDPNGRGQKSCSEEAWVTGRAYCAPMSPEIVKMPTLILSDTVDARVPITQAYQLYHAWKDNRVTVKFVVYPVPGHFPRDPVRSRECEQTMAGRAGPVPEVGEPDGGPTR